MAESYAIIESGGKQYRAEKGGTLVVDRLRADEGDKVTLRPLMFRGSKKDEVVVAGNDLEKVKVEAKVTGHERGQKIRIFKYRAKKGFRKRAGHRSELTRLEVTEVKMLSRKPAAKKTEAEAKPAERRAAGAGREEARGREAAGRGEEARGQEARRGQEAGGEEARGREAAGRREGGLAMAHKKGLGSSRNGRDSNPKMLGVKVFAGQRVDGGEIIVRQRGTRFRAGDGAGLGRDHTIFATRPGTVAFSAGRKGRVVTVVDGE